MFLGHPKIIHRDIKSANILLDDSFEAQACTLPFFVVQLISSDAPPNFIFGSSEVLVSDLRISSSAGCRLWTCQADE